MVFFSDLEQTVGVSGMDAIRGAVIRDVNDPSIMEVTLSERAGGWQVIMMKGAVQTHYLLVEIDPCASVIRGVPIALVRNVNLVDLGDREVTRLVPVPAQEHFLTCIDGKLKKVGVDAGNGSATLSFTDIEGADINLNDFGVASSGDVLYWPASRDSGSYVIDENGEATLPEGGEVYQIVGARFRNGKLSCGMVLSEVSHPMHRIRSFDQSSNYLSFISSNAVDDEAGKGELWYTAVSWVRCATLVAAVPSTTVLAAGDQLSFYLMLRNDGNCYLSGVELSVAEVGQKPFGIMRLVFSEDNTLESEWNPRGDDDKLQGVEDDWALAPGMSARYRADYVTIPKSWQGDKQVELFVSAVYIAGSGGLSEPAEDDSIEYIPDQRARSTLSTGPSSTSAGYLGDYSTSDVTVYKPGPSPNSERPNSENGWGRSGTQTPTGQNTGTGAGSGSGSGTTDPSTRASSSQASSTRSAAPNTGDALFLAAAAVTGAAGIAARTVLNALEKREELAAPIDDSHSEEN